MNAADHTVPGRKLAGLRGGGAMLGAASLLAANLGLLLLYLVYGLTLEQLILVFWWESLWIGVFAALKLLTASLFGDPYRNRYADLSVGANLMVTLLALVFVSGEFLGLFMLSGMALWFALAELSGADPAMLMLDQLGIVLGSSLLFLAGHGLSFAANFLLLGEFRSARAGTLLALPFKRCLALYAAILVAFVVAFGLPEFARTGAFACALILLKLVGDYRLHCKERRALAALPYDYDQS